MDEIVTCEAQELVVAKHFKALMANIYCRQINKEAITILVTSCYHNEGKSWTCANLATSFSNINKKVLLIDLDLKNGKQAEKFKVKSTPGLSDILQGNMPFTKSSISKYIKRTKITNLSVIPAGNLPSNSLELLFSSNFEDLLKILKPDYNAIILDGTPAILDSDSMLLTKMVDNTIIVTAVNKVTRGDLIKLKKSIENAGGKITGVVLNKIPSKIKNTERKIR